MKRSEFLSLMGFGALASVLASASTNTSYLMQNKQPVLFLGHGSPMNTIEQNAFTLALRKLGASITPKPKAILCVSAHWLTKGTFVHQEAKPKMIYDMYGFPDKLYQFKYPANGAPEEAKLAKSTVKSIDIGLDSEWGLDHGCYSVLAHLFPEADVPVFQLSIDYNKPMSFHYQLARELSSLRDKGVLIVASGNVTHNLGRVDFRNENAKPVDWALEFDTFIKNNMISGNHEAIVDYLKMGSAAKMSHPEPSHFIPLLYALGMQGRGDEVTFPHEGFVFGSLSMRCAKIA